MGFLDNSETNAVVSIRLTNAGRKLIANGFKSDNIFDMVKFSFGDSDIDYGVGTALIEAQQILEPDISSADIVHKIYASGVEPSGDAIVALSTSQLDLTTYQSGVTVNALTSWPPVDGNYIERYSWTNLGPLEDYDFGMTTSIDSTTATIKVLGVVGTTQIRIKGETTGKYALLTLNIT